MTTGTVRLIHDADGLNTAVPPQAVAGDLITPVDRFFTRSHAPVPEIDPGRWRLEVAGLVWSPLSLGLAELAERFPIREVAATVVCAGLRRVEFLSLGPLPGELPWGPEPASTGRWRGVALRDVLALAGLDDRAKHLGFVGLDQVERHGRRFGFGGSIPRDQALLPDTLLAFELNGGPLPPVHGYPVRVVVPGYVGARSVKWLGRIEALAEPSANYFQTEAYRVQRTANPASPRDVTAGEAMGEVPLNAVILDPGPEARLAAGASPIRGWAMGTGGAAITAVEVSANEGRTWVRAAVAALEGRWAWTLWEATVRLPPGRHTLVVRASDATGAAQPSSVRETWNVKGYANNAWHRVAVIVE